MPLQAVGGKLNYGGRRSAATTKMATALADFSASMPLNRDAAAGGKRSSGADSLPYRAGLMPY